MTRDQMHNTLRYVREQLAEERGSDFSGVKALDLVLEELVQEQKTGHWIIIDDCEQFIAKCSECGRIEDSRMISKYPYCHCGARMKSEAEE